VYTLVVFFHGRFLFLSNSSAVCRSLFVLIVDELLESDLTACMVPNDTGVNSS